MRCIGQWNQSPRSSPMRWSKRCEGYFHGDGGRSTLAAANSSICWSLHSTRRRISRLWARGQRIRRLEEDRRIGCVGDSELVEGGSGAAGSSHS
uniref:Uncharacterized protein n=1 Tax=Oryza barthii TaxID=65489 RepID=A0A0D3HAK0_9ORYZ